jgi:hypothetical protein
MPIPVLSHTRNPEQCFLPNRALIPHKNSTANTPTAPSPTPAPPILFATAPPVPIATLALAAAVFVAPLPNEKAVFVPVADEVLVNIVIGALLFAAPCVSAVANVELLFHMTTLGWEVTTAGMEVTTEGMPVMMPTEFVSVVKEVKPLV